MCTHGCAACASQCAVRCDDSGEGRKNNGRSTEDENKRRFWEKAQMFEGDHVKILYAFIRIYSNDINGVSKMRFKAYFL